MQTKESIIAILKNYRKLDMKRKMMTAAGKTASEIEEFAFVVACIEQLDDETKEIIEKVYKQGMSVREYAKRNYCSHTTVFRRIRDAAQAIAECFEK